MIVQKLPAICSSGRRYKLVIDGIPIERMLKKEMATRLTDILRRPCGVNEHLYSDMAPGKSPVAALSKQNKLK